MRIIDFNAGHIRQAITIARNNYETERSFIPALPTVTDWPDMTGFVQNTLGVAAFDGNIMLGFLCCWGPFENAFGSTGARGVFSPMHANGTVPENRAKIYARLYQAAGEKWARAGAASHAVCLYAHDTEGQMQFFRYGFGRRTVDAIRLMDDIAAPPCGGYTFSELMSGEVLDVLPLINMLNRHCLESPFFMVKRPETEDSLLKNIENDKNRYFVARKNGVITAYLCTAVAGETFLQDIPGYIHINGAFCLPSHRGKGVYHNVMAYAARTLKAEGYIRFGTDFESINPTAYGFWLKHFEAYTHGVVRRIDEGAVI